MLPLATNSLRLANNLNFWSLTVSICFTFTKLKKNICIVCLHSQRILSFFEPSTKFCLTNPGQICQEPKFHDSRDLILSWKKNWSFNLVILKPNCGASYNIIWFKSYSDLSAWHILSRCCRLFSVKLSQQNKTNPIFKFQSEKFRQLWLQNSSSNKNDDERISLQGTV